MTEIVGQDGTAARIDSVDGNEHIGFKCLIKIMKRKKIGGRNMKISKKLACYVILCFGAMISSLKATPESTLIEKARAVKTIEEYEQLLMEMQKNVKSYYAKGNIKGTTINAGGSKLESESLWEQWGKLTSPGKKNYSYYSRKFKTDMKRILEIRSTGSQIWSYLTTEDKIVGSINADLTKMWSAKVPISLIMLCVYSPDCLHVPQIDNMVQIPALFAGRFISFEAASYFFHDNINNSIQYVGQENISGFTCLLFEHNIKATGESSQIAYHSKIWIDAATGLFVKIEYSGDKTYFSKEPGKVFTHKYIYIINAMEIIINDAKASSMDYNYVPPPNTQSEDVTESLSKYLLMSPKERKDYLIKLMGR